MAESANETSKEFELNLVQGVVYPLDVASHYLFDLRVPGAATFLDVRSSWTYQAKVIAPTDEGYYIHLAFEDIRLNEGVFVDPTGNEEDGVAFYEAWKKYESLFDEVMEGLYLELVLSKKGFFISLKGVDGFNANIMENFYFLVEGESQSDVDGMLSRLCLLLFEKAQGDFRDLYRFSPDKGVSIGDQWQKVEEVANLDVLTRNYSYDRVVVNNDFILFGGEFDLTLLGRVFTGWTQGFWVVDSHTGWVISSYQEENLDYEDLIVIDGLSVPSKLRFNVKAQN